MWHLHGIASCYHVHNMAWNVKCLPITERGGTRYMSTKNKAPHEMWNVYQSWKGMMLTILYWWCSMFLVKDNNYLFLVHKDSSLCPTSISAGSPLSDHSSYAKRLFGNSLQLKNNLPFIFLKSFGHCWHFQLTKFYPQGIRTTKSITAVNNTQCWFQ